MRHALAHPAAAAESVATRTRIKICGFTRPGDAVLAVSAGADAIGVIFAASPRRVTPQQAREILAALPASAVRVGVFADQPLEDVLAAVEDCGLDWIQLCGDEPAEFAAALPRPVLRAVHVRSSQDIDTARRYPAAAFILDAPARDGRRGGTGSPFDWSIARDLPWPPERVVIAGGLNAANVGAAIASLRPAAVDVASGVEAAPGVKDAARMKSFIAAVRAADARPGSSSEAERGAPSAEDG